MWLDDSWTCPTFELLTSKLSFNLISHEANGDDNGQNIWQPYSAAGLFPSSFFIGFGILWKQGEVNSVCSQTAHAGPPAQSCVTQYEVCLQGKLMVGEILLMNGCRHVSFWVSVLIQNTRWNFEVHNRIPTLYLPTSPFCKLEIPQLYLHSQVISSSISWE